MTDQEEAARGAAARREWAEVEDAFGRLRQEMLEEIARSSPDHLNKRERLYMAVQSLDGVKTALLRLAGAGAAASARMALAEDTALLRP